MWEEGGEEKKQRTVFVMDLMNTYDVYASRFIWLTIQMPVRRDNDIQTSIKRGYGQTIKTANEIESYPYGQWTSLLGVPRNYVSRTP